MDIRFELKNVHKAYGDHGSPLTVLEGVDMKVYDKKINLLVGRSGCGKSTLLRLLLGLEDADSGDILYKGRDIESLAMEEFRRKNQVMFQNPLLSVNPYFKAGKIIAEPLVIAGTKKEGIREKVQQLARHFQLDPHVLEQYPNQLSAGQLQRVVFARALSLEPEFLLLDEPFSALDEIMTIRLMDLFLDIQQKFNLGILLVTHRPDRFYNAAHSITYLQDGRASTQVFDSRIREYSAGDRNQTGSLSDS